MAHYAELDKNAVVLRVIVIEDACETDAKGKFSEAAGVAWCQDFAPSAGRWIKTSYNGNVRKNFAGPGYSYDAGRDAFIPLKTYPSWVLDESTCQWVAPVPYPEDGKIYYWDEDALSWVEAVA